MDIRRSERLAPLTEDAVRRWVGERSFERGSEYYRQRRLGHLRRRGRELRARCHGSLPTPYLVRVTLGTDRIVFAYCSCPMGDTGQCKHVAALLLHWVAAPSEFTEELDLRSLLLRRSVTELVGLVEMMIRRYPDLEDLLDLADAGDDAIPGRVDAEAIRREVERVLRAGSAGWTADGQATARQILNLLDQADLRLQADQVRDARVIYTVVANTLMSHWETYPDEEGRLLKAIGDCAEGLGRCLAVESGVADRRDMFNALLGIYLWDLSEGGHGAMDTAAEVMLRHANRQESEALAARLWESLPAGGAWLDSLKRQDMGAFYLRLRGDELTDEEYLAVCRNTGQRVVLVARLLDLGRDNEAQVEAAKGAHWEILPLADVLVSAGRAEMARRLVRKHLGGSNTRRLLAWLRDEALGRGDLGGAVSYAERLFVEVPSLEEYRALCALGQRAGHWDRLRSEVVSILAEKGKRELLIQVHLLEGQVGEALTLIKEARDGQQSLPTHIVAEAAEKIEQEKPREALDLYLGLARDLIEQRGRTSYAQAARYLKRARYLCRRIGEPEMWNQVLEEIVQNNRRLRALREELQAAGLL